jgi:transcription antitermination factor NusG
VTGRREAYQSESPRPLWYALRVRVKHEFKVRDSLRALGISEFLPAFTEESRWIDRIKIIQRPYFTGYIFAKFDRFLGAAAILGINGVLQILGSNETSSISEDVIANLRTIVESPAPVVRCSHVVGTRATVARGPFAGLSGIVTHTKGVCTVWVSIEILNCARGVEIDVADLEKRPI